MPRSWDVGQASGSVAHQAAGAPPEAAQVFAEPECDALGLLPACTEESLTFQLLCVLLLCPGAKDRTQ